MAAKPIEISRLVFLSSIVRRFETLISFSLAISAYCMVDILLLTIQIDSAMAIALEYIPIGRRV